MLDLRSHLAKPKSRNQGTSALPMPAADGMQQDPGTFDYTVQDGIPAKLSAAGLNLKASSPRRCWLLPVVGCCHWLPVRYLPICLR